MKLGVVDVNNGDVTTGETDVVNKGRGAILTGIVEVFKGTTGIVETDNILGLNIELLFI